MGDCPATPPGTVPWSGGFTSAALEGPLSSVESDPEIEIQPPEISPIVQVSRHVGLLWRRHFQKRNQASNVSKERAQ